MSQTLSGRFCLKTFPKGNDPCSKGNLYVSDIALILPTANNHILDTSLGNHALNAQAGRSRYRYKYIPFPRPFHIFGFV